MKKFRSLKWFPHPYSWLNALILFLLTTGLVATIGRNRGLWLNLLKLSDKPELLTVVTIFLLILPIPAIAFVHHFLLSLLIPAIPGEKISKTQGFLPGLISWRESLYSWLVLVVSTLMATFICTPLLALFRLNYTQIISAYGQNFNAIATIFAIVWLISATILYQIDYLFKSRLVFSKTVTSEPNIKNNFVSNETPNERFLPKIDLTQVQMTEETPKAQTNFINPFYKYQKVIKQVFTFVLVPLVALWIYSFVKLPEVRQTISANISTANPSPVVSKKSASLDNYEQAINKAKRAAKLAQLAQSEDEWKIVMNSWDEAIALMKTVPYTSQNYSTAQQQIIQYQFHREFARQYTLGSN